jgi:hypothetical protein
VRNDRKGVPRKISSVRVLANSLPGWQDSSRLDSAGTGGGFDGCPLRDTADGSIVRSKLGQLGHSRGGQTARHKTVELLRHYSAAAQTDRGRTETIRFRRGRLRLLKDEVLAQVIYLRLHDHSPV